MFQYRAVLVRLRQGDSDRDIARAAADGPAQGRARCGRWPPSRAGSIPRRRCPRMRRSPRRSARRGARASTISTVEPYRELVERWAAGGVSGVAIHAALCREHGYRRQLLGGAAHVAAIGAARTPEATVPLQLRPRRGRAGRLRRRADAARSGGGRAATHLVLRDDAVLVAPPVRRVRLGPDGGDLARLSPPRLRVVRRRARAAHHRQPQVRDHPACVHDPLVQRAYAECAEGYGFKIDPCPPARSAKKGIVEAGREVRQGQLPAHSRVPRSRRPECPGASLGDGRGRRAHPRHHPRAARSSASPWRSRCCEPLPAIAPDLGTWHRVGVHRDCHVQFDRRALLGALRAGRQAPVAARDRLGRRDLRGLSARRHCIRARRKPGERLTVHRASAARGAGLLRPRPATGASQQAQRDRPGLPPS